MEFNSGFKGLKCASKYSVDKCGLYSGSSGQWQAIVTGIVSLLFNTLRNTIGLAK